MERKATEIINKFENNKNVEMVKDFIKFMKKYEGELLLPHYTIAEYCILKENNNPIRTDILKIKSTKKEVV